MGKDKKIKKKRKKRESEGECKKPRLDSSSAEGQECSRKNDHSGTCNNAERKREGSSSIAQVDQPDRSATVCEVSTLYSRSDSTCDDTVECQREDGNGTGSNKLKKTFTYHSSQIDAVEQREDLSDGEISYEMDRPTLLRQLQVILSEYPDDAQILRELVQNAEDAGASCMKIIYDNTVNQPDGSSSLCQYFKSPGIAVFNDSMFTDKDWKGIIKIYDSIKQDEPLKVGRFGLGFKSVFHMTDSPVIISGKKIVVIDPIRSKRKENEVREYALERIKRQDPKSRLFCIMNWFGFSALENNGYRGTLFWFPLRQGESSLSDTIYSPKKAKRLLHSFMMEATYNLLFLKHLEKIEIFDIKENKSKLDYNLEMVDIDDRSFTKEKTQFKEKLAGLEKQLPAETITSQYEVIIRTNETEECFHVVNCLFGTKTISEEMRDLLHDKDLHYSPYTGVAYCTRSSHSMKQPGHIFCFLPLPITDQSMTGLPFHVNGFFALEHNRRHLKEAASNSETKDSDKCLLWNEKMIVELLPETFRILIQQLKAKSVAGKNTTQLIQDVYGSIPDPELIHSCWKPMLKILYGIVLEEAYFFSNQLQGHGKWIKLSDALVAYFDDGDTGEVQSTVKQLLLDCKCNLVELPPHIIKVLKFMKMEPKKITPEIVVDKIRNSDCWKSYTPDKKLHLLGFLLKYDNFSLLKNIQLLSMKSGTFIEFQCSDTEKVFITEDKTSNLFPGMDHRFVSRNGISDTIWQKLESIADKGCYQLSQMHKADLPKLLTEVFKRNFTKKSNQSFIPNNSSEFSIEWIVDIWKKIASEGFQDLTDFEALPIIPLVEHESNKVYEFLILKGLYIKPLNGRTSDVICKVLQLVCVKLVSEHDTIKFPHGDVFGKYVLHPTDENVMTIFNESLLNVDPDKIAESINKTLDEAERVMLASYFDDHVKIIPTETQIHVLLKKIKMFRVHDNVTEPILMSIEENRKVLDNFELQFPPGVAYPRKVIQCKHVKLSQCLGAILVNEMSFMKDTLILMRSKPHMYDIEHVILIMKYLQNPAKLVTLKEVLNEAKQLEFVRVKDNTYHQPRDLFNPTNDNLKALFYGQEDVFPDENFLEETGLEIELLEKLGLKEPDDINSVEFGCIASRIHQLQSNDSGDDKHIIWKAETLIKYLKQRPQYLTNFMMDQIKSRRWVKPSVRPEGYPTQLTWWTNHQFCCPDEMKSMEFKWLIGSTVPLVDQTLFPECLVKHYRWGDSPDTSEVISHFKEVIESYDHDQNALYLLIAKNIFQFIHKARQTERLSKENIVELQEIQCIPTRNTGFKDPSMVVRKIDRSRINYNLEPFLFEMATETEPFIETCFELGMLKEIDLEVLKLILKRIDMKYKEREELEQVNVIEFNADLSLVTNVLKTIVDWKIDKSLLLDLLVPVLSSREDILVLEPVEKCTYTSGKSVLSATYLQHEENENESDEIIYTHPNIRDFAAKLGVASVTKRFMVDQNTAPMAWGQEEKLTTRISGLLESYADGLAVLKELIQNSDDAGATKVKILYDERKNQGMREGLFDPEMAECQGQALWVYNDALFEEKDFENIIKLGGKTKIVDTEKIGKFGLGFCSVYNITDVPSFVSGKSMIILDPHLFHLGEAAIGSNPGLRIPLTTGYKKNFPNQFSPFNNVFGCNLEPSNKSEYQSTLFRLPLRTQAQADKSELRKLPYTKREVVELLQKFLEGAGNVLLFTQNVTEVCIYHLDHNSTNPDSEMKLIFRISKFKAMKTGNDYNVLKKVTAAMKNDIFDNKLPLHCIDISIEIFDNELSEQFRKRQEVQSWIISWASGNLSFELAKQLREKGAIPVGSVAVPVLRRGEEIASFCCMTDLPEVGFYKDSHIFCFLPLPEKTNLPIHINGCFNVEQDRKRISYQSEDDKDTHSSEWNDYMFKEVIKNAYLDLLVSIAKRHSDSILEEDYWALWPKVTKGSRHFTDLVVNSFYNGILIEPFPAVFYRKEKGQHSTTCSIEQCVFLEPSFRSSNMRGEYAFECLLNFFDEESCDGNVMDMKIEVFDRFQIICGERIKTIENCILTKQKFFEKYFFPHLEDPYWKQSGMFEKRNALLKEALDDPSLRNMLTKTACIPVKSANRDILKMPSELVYENGFVKALFDEADYRFPINDLKEFSDTLLILGMMDSKIPSGLLVERAESVKNLKYPETVSRSKSIILYLEQNYSLHADVIETLKTTPFLPIMTKPEHWPLSWKADTLNVETLLSSSELYGALDRNKVGSVGFIVDDMKDLHTTTVDKAIKFLQFKPVSLEVAVSQLEVLGKTNVVHTKNLEKICMDLYSELNILLSKSSPDTDIEERLDFLRDRKVMCLKSTIVKPNQVAAKIDGDCSPYLYQHNLHKFEVLWNQMHIPEEFDCDKFIAVIVEIGNAYRGTKMKEQDVRRMIDILSNLCSTIDGGGISDGKRQGLVIPDKDNFIRPISEVCFDDLYKGFLRGCKSAKIIHPFINQVMVRKLGIMSKRQFHLSKFSSGIPFGQKEKLVTRLKGIVSAYPRDHSMLNELLQNADDAGATEIHFVLDSRQHGTQHIFDNSWKPLQGPALCVFNDKCFSEKDIEGIQNLGEGSKSDDPTKTGKFGVGFNSVYHVTDAPSFLTKGPQTPNGGTFCVFDPHCRYAPNAEPEFPGMQMEDLDIFEESFNDVYSTYLQKELGYKEGTCFRLPLRTEEMATFSEIKSDSTTPEDMSNMLDNMKTNMKMSLLFLANVKKISISEINNFSGKLMNTASVNSVLSPENESKRIEFMSNIKDTFRSIKQRGSTLKDIVYSEVQYSVVIDSNDWLIVQGFGFPEPHNVPDRLVHEFTSKSIGLLPRSGVAFRSNRNDDGRAFCFLPLPIDNGLPVHVNAHFALDVNRSSIFGGTYKEDIRFIWNKCLMEQTVANTYASALLYQREMIQNYCNRDMLSSFFQKFPTFDGANGDWWQILVFNVYRRIIEREVAIFPICLSYFEDDYVEDMPLQWVSLKTKGESFEAVFDNLHTFFNIKQLPSDDNRSHFGYATSYQSLDYESRTISRPTLRKKGNFKKEQRVREILINLGMKLICTPQNVSESITQACLKFMHEDKNERSSSTETIPPGCICPKQVHPRCTIDFLKSWNSSKKDKCLIDTAVHIGRTVLKDVDRVLTLLHFCLLEDEMEIQLLENVPLLLRNDGILQAFKLKNSTILSKYCELFPALGDKFVHSREVDLLEKFSQNFMHLEIDIFRDMLETSISATPFRLNGPIKIPSKGLVSTKWLNMFWKCLDTFDKIDILNDWCLLPCTWSDQSQQLVSLGFGNVICDNDSFRAMETKFDASKRSLRTIFTELSLPSMDLITKKSQHIRDLVASYKYPKKIINCLYFNRVRIQWAKWIPNDCVEVLKYLNNAVKSYGSSEKEQFQTLPLFTTLTGQTVCLNKGSRRLVVKCENLTVTEGLNEISENTNTLLLKHNAFHENLYGFLGCHQCYSTDKHPLLHLYTSFILPNFGLLPSDAQLSHIEFVRTKLLIYKNDVQSHLKTLHFIPSGSAGDLKMAGNFFSPHNRLFALFCDERELPPEPFCTEEWKEFMELAGMQTVPRDEMFIRFANELQQKGKTCNSEKHATELLENLFIVQDLENKVSFLDEISKIAFIPPYIVSDEYSSVCKQFSDRNQLISFRDSILQNYQNVVWTMENILPEYAIMKCNETVLKHLNVQTIPRLTRVISHIHNVSESLQKQLKNKTCSANITDILNGFYDYLEQVNVSDNELKVRFSETPLIHIQDHNTMIEAKYVVKHMKKNEEIAPYLLKASDYYGRHFQLFLRLGAADEISLEHYCRVLETIKKGSQNNVVLPGDELKAVEKAIVGVLLCLQMNDQTNVDNLEQREVVLYILSEKHILKPSTELVISDPFRIKRRLQSQDEIEFTCDWSGIRGKHTNMNPDMLLLNLPTRMRPKKLSDIVTEELTIDSPTIVHSTFANALEEFLTGEKFRYIVKRLVKTYEREFTTEVAETELEEIFKKLKSLKVCSTNEIETVIVYKGMPIKGSISEQNIFFVKHKNTFYLKDRVQFRKQTNYLAGILADICKRKVQKHHLSGILPSFEDDLMDIETLLDDLNLEKASFKLADMSWYPSPGSPLERDMIEYLVNDFSTFESGDVAVFEHHDRSGDNDDDDVMIYIFVKVIKLMSSGTCENERFPEYLVSVGDGDEKRVRSYRLYKLVRSPEATPTEIELFTYGDTLHNEAKRAEILQVIEEILVDAMKLGLHEFKRVLRRLIRRWHPDKNHNSKFCEAVFQHMLEFANKLQTKQIDVSKIDTFRERGRWNYYVRRATSEGREPQHGFDVNNFADDISRGWNRRRRQRHSRISHFREYVPDPQPHMAILWIKQAKHDINSARSTLHGVKDTSMNWICIQSQQAAEKALKSVQVRRDAKRVKNDDTLLQPIIYETDNEVIKQKAEKLQGVIGNYSRMRYPLCREYPEIPATLYSRENAEKAVELASAIVELIDEKYFQ